MNTTRFKNDLKTYLSIIHVYQVVTDAVKPNTIHLKGTLCHKFLVCLQDNESTIK